MFRALALRRSESSVSALKPGSRLCDKHNTSDISISISTRKKEHVPFFLCLCLCLCRLCYAYRTSMNQALGLSEGRDRDVNGENKLNLLYKSQWYSE